MISRFFQHSKPPACSQVGSHSYHDLSDGETARPAAPPQDYFRSKPPSSQLHASSPTYWAFINDRAGIISFVIQHEQFSHHFIPSAISKLGSKIVIPVDRSYIAPGAIPLSTQNFSAGKFYIEKERQEAESIARKMEGTQGMELYISLVLMVLLKWSEKQIRFLGGVFELGRGLR
jgi:hypothetical protein